MFVELHSDGKREYTWIR